MAQYSGILVAAAPRLTTAATTEEFDEVALSIDEAYSGFEEQLALLEEGTVGGESYARIRAHADTLIYNIEAIKEGTSESFTLTAGSEALGAELAKLRTQLDGIVVPAIDDQLFYVMTGYRNLLEPSGASLGTFLGGGVGPLPSPGPVAGGWQHRNGAFSKRLHPFSGVADRAATERFEAATSRMERNLSALGESPLRGQVSPIFTELRQMGVGEESGFDLLARRLTLAETQQDLIASNRDIAIDLVEEVNGLVNTARASAQAATQASSNAILTGRILLLVIGGISIAGALLIAWLFVGRILARRLKLLSDWMRRMAEGDLEASVEIEGRDEVAEMAAALEVFRRHALEVQRLNLVEKLADELKGKNEQLEVVLEDLRLAQDQIVMREKLAALGELTAGVAHEIRNPLNFVNNFSEVSEELVTELQGVLKEEGATLTDEQTGLVEDIFGDLRSNLTRIRSHGERANRIVHDMLLMGRDSGELQSTNINNLVDEHARLAYHSVRATNPDFQLDLQQDFDPDMGELEVIPQELGRVFLNMVSNACYATDQKRRTAAGAGGDPYMPTLLLTTRREEDHAEVRIRDNGSGMPPEVIEKIFNPFFTTKPANEGTGLGLAMSSDIVRKHGGAIRVESEPDQFTEMIIEMPLTPPSTVLVEEEETAAVAAQRDGPPPGPAI